MGVIKSQSCEVSILCSPITILSIVLLVILGILWSFLGVRSLDRAKMARVQPGMTQQAVQSILGGPPGHYGWNHGPMSMSAEGGYRSTLTPEGTSNLNPVHELHWTDDYTMFEVYFDTNNVVLGVHKRVLFRLDSLVFSYCADLLLRCRKAFLN